MNAALTLVLFLSAGAFFGSTRLATRTVKAAFSKSLINVFIPAACLLHMHDLRLDLSAALAVATPWVCFIAAFAFFHVVGKASGWSNQTVGALTITCGIGNTAFVGLPVVDAMLGAQAMPVAIALDQAGTWLCLATLGALTSIYYSSEGCGISVTSVAKKLAKYPPFIAIIVALATRDLAYPEALTSTLSALVLAMAPVALFATGAQMKMNTIHAQKRELIAGLGFKSIAWPLAIVAVFQAAGLEGTVAAKASAIEAAMGPSIGAAAMASGSGLNEKLCSALVAVGVPFGVLAAVLLHHL